MNFAHPSQHGNPRGSALSTALHLWRTRAFVPVAACALLTACANLGLAAQPAAPSSAPAPSSGTPRLQVTPASLDFGEVWQGERAAADFTVMNMGSAPLTLSLKSSCGCTLVTRPRSPLEPGESDTFQISYDTLKRKGKASQQVTLTTNDPDQPSVRIAVTGEVKPLYLTTPAEGLVFESLTCDSQATRSIRIQNKYDGPLHLKLHPEQDFGSFVIELKEIEPGAEYELCATTKPPLLDDFARTTVLVDTDVERSPQIHIPVHARVRQDVSIRPKLLRAQRQLVVPREETLTVTYRSDRPIKITEVRPSVPDIKVELPAAHPARDSSGWMEQPIRLTLPPGDQLPKTGDVSITVLTDSSEERFRELRIPVMLVEPGDSAAPREPAPPTDADGGTQEQAQS